MKLNFSFLSNDTADLVRRSIKSRYDWRHPFLLASWFDAGELGDRVEWGECEGLECFGDDQQPQLPFPAAPAGLFAEAQAAHLGVYSEIESEHPLVWMFWASGSSAQGVEDLANSLSELSDGASLVFLSNPAAAVLHNLGGGDLPYAFEGLVSTSPFGLGDNQVSLRLESRVDGYHAFLHEGDPGDLAAVLEASLSLQQDQRRALQESLDYLASRLRSTLETLQAAQSNLQGYLTEALELRYSYLRSIDQEAYYGARGRARQAVSSLISPPPAS